MAKPKKIDKKDVTLAFKVTGMMDVRLRAAASFTKLTPSAIAIAAVDAALSAIERDRGIVFPVKFDVARRPEVQLVPVGGEGPAAGTILTDAKERQAATERRRRREKRDASQEATGNGPDSTS